jgi:type I restriction enzyme S subunit
MADYVSLTAQRSFQVPVPDIGIQRKIASFIKPIDDSIANDRQIAQRTEEVAYRLFLSYLASPNRSAGVGGLSRKNYKDSSGMKSNELWSTEPLDAIADFLNGLAMQKFPLEVDGEPLPVLKIAQLKSGSLVGADQASSVIPHDYIVEDGDVIFSWSGSLLVRIWCGGQCALNQHLFKVTSSRFPRWFYYLWIKVHLREFQDIADGKKTTMGHIRRHHLTDALVNIPPTHLMDQLSELLTALLDRHVEAQLHMKTLARLRDAMVPLLMTGSFPGGVSPIPPSELVAAGL